jgi:hypothetical protein
MARIEEKITGMTKQEKVAELRSYFECGWFPKLDVDQIIADQVVIGAPDSALDDALLKIAIAAGIKLNREPVTAQELAEALKDRDISASIGMLTHAFTP